jgi:MFS transporter, DHA3 family, multidrug efflux protein
MLHGHNMHNYPLFYKILANNLLAGVTNNLVWFALTFWVFIETQSVLATSWIAGIFALASMVGGFVFGPIVDHERKQTAMLQSSLFSLILFSVGSALYFTTDPAQWSNASSPYLWGLIVVLMLGVIANNLRMIALSTTVTMLFDNNRDKANGLVGMTHGISFALTSVISGVLIGFFGMGVTLIVVLVSTTLVILHLYSFTIDEPKIVHLDAPPPRTDIKKTYLLILSIPGLLGLIFFNTFNNFLGGVFMALMDPYGLSLMSVKWWGAFWGIGSLMMIAGSLYVSRYGVGNNPLKRIMLLNLITWSICIVFPIQASITLLVIGMFVWLTLFPIIEAAEQTILQAVVPFERQGRVFGFAQSLESFATPITALLMGPLAHFFFIPFMTTGAGVDLIGDWFGVGADRGMGLIFIMAGIVGVIVTMIALHSGAYRRLSNHYSVQNKSLT